VRVSEPSECIEVTAAPALRTRIAHELNVPKRADLDEGFARHDPVIWGLSCEMRARVRAGTTIDAVALEECVLRLYHRVFKQFLGGRDDARGDGGLSSTRTSLVFDWIEAHLSNDFSIVELASAASLTTSHFIRSFRRTTGLSPHQYVRARRLERARAAIVHGATTAGAAAAAGFESLSQFRRAFKSQYGFAPSATPRPGAKLWILPKAQIS
jgi:AraC family transcriptional regulator